MTIEEFKKDIPKNLRLLREGLSLDRAELAKACGLSYFTIRSTEEDMYRPAMATQRKLINYFGLQPEQPPGPSRKPEPTPAENSQVLGRIAVAVEALVKQQQRIIEKHDDLQKIEAALVNLEGEVARQSNQNERTSVFIELSALKNRIKDLERNLEALSVAMQP